MSSAANHCPVAFTTVTSLAILDLVHPAKNESAKRATVVASRVPFLAEVHRAIHIRAVKSVGSPSIVVFITVRSHAMRESAALAPTNLRALAFVERSVIITIPNEV